MARGIVSGGVISLVATATVLACGSSVAPPPAAPTPAASISAATVPASAQSASAAASPSDGCAGPTECSDCTARPGCRFCTAPRKCITNAAAQLAGSCDGLSLGHPDSCGSDPVVAARVHAREVEARRKAALDTTRGLTLSGSSMGARLETFSAIQIPVPAGVCHTVVWKLAPDAKPGDVRVSLDFVTNRSSDGGLTGFDLESGVGSSGVKCSSLSGFVRFKLVDRWSYGPVNSGGAGGISFELYTRPRRAGDPDDIGASPPPQAQAGAGPRGSVGVDCLDCTFPCSSSKTACERDCFRSGGKDWEKTICNNTCEQIHRACLRGCPGCW